MDWMDRYFKMLQQHEDAKAQAAKHQAEYEMQQRAVQIICETIALVTQHQTMSMVYLAFNPNLWKQQS